MLTSLSSNATSDLEVFRLASDGASGACPTVTTHILPAALV
jgi:hypothetical protein